MNIWPDIEATSPYPYPNKDDVVFKRHYCQWILPLSAAKYLKYNPRHLPVVIQRDQTNEAYYLYLSIRRIVHGYCVSTTEVPASPFLCEDVEGDRQTYVVKDRQPSVEAEVQQGLLALRKWYDSI